MIWLVVGGIGVLVVVAAACAWAVVALLGEVGDELDATADDSEYDSGPPHRANDSKRGRSRVARY